MPYYHWKGVDISASFHRGVFFAGNIEELERSLLKSGIALISVSERKAWLYMPIYQSVKIDFFKQVSTLLQSGILLPQALTILSHQAVNKKMQNIIVDISFMITNGRTLSDALKKKQFSLMMVHMIEVGEMSGCLSYAIDTLVTYLESTQKFKKRIQVALRMPLVTLIAFFIVVAGVMIGIVPRFAQLFKSAEKKLPAITEKLLQISFLLQSGKVWVFFITAIALIVGVFCVGRSYIKPYVDYFIVHVPIIGRLVIDTEILHWINALGILLKNKVPLVSALHIAYPLLQNESIKKELEPIATEVAEGNTLRFALLQAKRNLFTPDVFALVQIGQESGSLDKMIERIGVVYSERVENRLKFCTFVLQPLLLIFLGLLVSFLVFALYMPIFGLAHIG